MFFSSRTGSARTATPRSNRSSRRPGRWRYYRPRADPLEDRCLLSGSPALFDAPWRGFDTGTYPDAFGPGSFAVGDLDADGDADAVVGQWFFGGPGVSVLINRGDGTYDPPAHHPLPRDRSVGGVALADVDFDGTLDVLATIPGLSGQFTLLALWRNRGDGTLAPRVEFDAGRGPVGLAVADFDGDGAPDVAVANSVGTPAASLLRHNGLKGPAAGFLAPRTFPVADQAFYVTARNVAVADLNGDGLTDLTVGRTGNAYGEGYFVGVHAVLFNDGAGGFTLSASYPAVPPASRGESTAVVLADLDNDGDADLIGGGAASSGSTDFGLITVRRNAGDGTFGALETYRFANFIWTPVHLTAADLNADGYLDIVGATPSGRAGDGFDVLLSDGAGGFLPAVHYEASKWTIATAVADADGDGLPDVLTLGRDSAAVTVHRNLGGGVFPILTRNEAGSMGIGLDAADIDGDGDLDIVTTSEQILPGRGRVHVLRNNGDGTFVATVTYTPPITARDIKLRDLDGDGFPDLLLGPNRNSPPYHFATMRNNGDGTFAPGVITFVNACGEGTIDAADLDNDGDLDVALTEEQGCGGGGGGQQIFLFRNDGLGNFTRAGTVPTPGIPGGLAIADLNHDGNLDLVSAVALGVGVFLGNGDLTFQSALVSGAQAYRFTVADLNGDGELDLGILLPQDSFGTVSIGVSLGNGDGTFGPARTYPGASGLESAFRISSGMFAADVNRDGAVDLLVSNNASNDLSVFLNEGDGTLRAHQRYGVGYSARFPFAADFTGDGVPDVAALISLPPGGFLSAVVLLPGTAGGGGGPSPGVYNPFGAMLAALDSANVLFPVTSLAPLYREAVAFHSPGSRSAPWGERQKHQDNPERVAQASRILLSNPFRVEPEELYALSQGALRDPGL